MKRRPKREVSSEVPAETPEGKNTIAQNESNPEKYLPVEKRPYSRRYGRKLTLEIALFLDAVLLENLFAFYTEDQLVNLILSLMNNVNSAHIIYLKLTVNLIL